MKTRTLLRGIAALTLLTATTAGLAVPVALDTTNANNGISDLFSATFDGALSACGPSDPSYCPFFRGKPAPTRAIDFTPAPTRVVNTVPLGITPVPASGSFLDLTLNPGNTQVTLAGGTITFDSLVLTIRRGTPNETTVNATGAGIVFDGAPQVATLNAEGQAEFFVDLAPATAVDFSAFSVIAFPPNGSCAGSFCGLIPILTLDMVRYYILIDYDPGFTYFTASFIGQTGNNSILSVNFVSNAPEITVTDSKPAPDDLSVPFGSVSIINTATQTVTVTNSGTLDLTMGAIGLANPLAPPFSLANDNCTGATVAPDATCTFDVEFSPLAAGSVSDSLDIPSNDLDEPSVTISLSGIGTLLPVPGVTVTDSVAPATDLEVPFGSVAIGSASSQTITVTNDGDAPLVLGTPGTANALQTPFGIVADNCDGQTIAPAGTCTIEIDFAPNTPGLVNDSFEIPSNDPDEPAVTVAVSGTGTGDAIPDIVVTDDTPPIGDLLVPFGNVTVGTTRDRTVTVTNGGSANLVIGDVASANPVAAPFSITADNCSDQTLAPAANCTVLLRYTPSSTSASSDSLDIPSNDPVDPVVTVSITGTGINPGEGGVEKPSATGADGGFMAIDPATLLLFGAAGAWGWRRRRTG